MDAKRRALEFFKRAMLLIGAGILFSGCATHSIWEGPLLDSFHEPANPSRLTVYRVPGKEDYLVRYDDLSPSRDLAVPRAYYAERNRAETVRAQKPHFVNLNETGKGTSLPVLNPTNPQNHPGAEYPAYVVQENNQRFGIYGQGSRLVGEYDLPTYPTSAGTVKRVLLTPITLALDATVVGGYAFEYLAPWFIGNLSAIR
jgi:hypothetical protein